MHRSLRRILTAAVLLALYGASPALGDTASSSNWSGYSIHRPGVRFTRVVAGWIQPTAVCSSGHATYSAIWVGLGGYAQSSDALEQIGSEVDCTRSGRVASFAWYELVPAASRTIRMPVSSGDAMLADLSVRGHRVTLSLSDLTTGQSFHRALTAAAVDVSSAEWIVEAPSDCTSASTCQTLPLANFGSARFELARAQAADGHIGSISDRAWTATKIRLAPSGRRYIAYGGGATTVGTASPSGLTVGGTSFKVGFSPVSVLGNPLFARRASVAAKRLVPSGS